MKNFTSGKKGTGTSGPARLLVPALRTGEYRLQNSRRLLLLRLKPHFSTEYFALRLSRLRRSGQPLPPFAQGSIHRMTPV